MKKFTQLALASSILALSANTMAMTALDDATLSATTGQDGITIGVQFDELRIGELMIHDNDGYNAGVAGAIVIKGNATQADGVVVTHTGSQAEFLKLVIDTDGGTGATSANAGAFLNIAATVGDVTVDLGEIGVDKSNTYTAGTSARGVEGGTGYAKILNSLSLSLGQLDANIQLGNTPQGAMIKIDSTINGGLTLADISLHDAQGGGDLVIGNVVITDHSSNDLVVDTDINVTTNGLEIVSNSTNGQDIYIETIGLGSAANSIGDLEISNVRAMTGGVIGSTITITGH